MYNLKYSSLLLILLISTLGCKTESLNDQPRKQLFDFDWKFTLGDDTNFASRSYDDGAWRTLDLPHDWSIESTPNPESPSKGDGGYFANGMGWYRKTFVAPENWTSKKVGVYFEGVYMNAEVFINGQKLGLQPYGYTSFDFDLTPYLNIGSENVIAVRVDNSKQRNSRWYSGSGIYRHIWLQITEYVHVAHWGVAITTPEVSKDHARVIINSKIENESSETRNLVLHSTVFDSLGNQVGTTKTSLKLSPRDNVEQVQELEIKNPKLWSPNTPNLYRASIEIMEKQVKLDSLSVPFGIRSIEFSAEDGFVLNGEKTILNGGNVHHDNGSLGAASYDRAEFRKVELLKEAGFNAVRTSHNPPSEAFLHACDSLGLFVIDESFDGWRTQKTEFDYATYFDNWWRHDIKSTVLRDRNHPSIILWSIGNEIIERKDPEAVVTAKNLATAVRDIDTTRAVTSAMTTWDADWEIFDPLMAEHDVAGYNYQMHRAESDHERVSDRIILHTESYAKNTFYNWKMVKEHDYIIGDFIWTAMDYLGESAIGRYYYPGEPDGEHFQGDFYPWHGAYCGDIDLLGWRKPISHYRSMLFNGNEMLYMAVREPNPQDGEIKLTSWAVWPTWESWTWPGYENQVIEVEVYSKYPKVRLYLNNALIDEKEVGLETEYKVKFPVAYKRGILQAVGIKDGQEMESVELKSANEPFQINLTVDRAKIKADGQDLAYVSVQVSDENGILQSNADNKLHFEIEGPGTIIGVDNANLTDTEPYQSNKRKAWNGKALVIVKSGHQEGEILLRVSSEGLKGDSIKMISINENKVEK